MRNIFKLITVSFTTNEILSSQDSRCYCHATHSNIRMIEQLNKNLSLSVPTNYYGGMTDNFFVTKLSYYVPRQVKFIFVPPSHPQ